MSSVSDAVARVRARGSGAARNLLRRLPSRPAIATPPPPAAPAEPAAPSDSRGPLVEQLERGRALDEAVIDEVRAMVADGAPGRALALAESLRRDPATSALGRVAAGIVAHERG